jgi:hypothetical protein
MLGASTSSRTAPGGGAGELTFTIDVPPGNPRPTAQSVAPSTIATGSSDTQISLVGISFVSGVSQVFAGTSALPTLFVSSNELDAVIPRRCSPFRDQSSSTSSTRRSVVGRATISKSS